MERALKAASQSYGNGYTCSQAVFCAYAADMGIDEETAYRIMEGFGGGVGGMQEVCGAFSAACAVISYHCSDGSLNGGSKLETYRKIQKAADIFQREYGGITCRKILHGEKPKPFQCGMKVKDSVLLIERLLKETAASG